MSRRKTSRPGFSRSQAWMALAEGVLSKAFEDAMAGYDDAIKFIETKSFDFWCRVAGYNPQRMRTAVKELLRREGRINDDD